MVFHSNDLGTSNAVLWLHKAWKMERKMERKQNSRIDFDAIRDAAKIGTMIGRYLELAPGYRNKWKCPKCGGKISHGAKVWQCWGCEAAGPRGGDTIDLVALVTGQSRIDAARELAAELGIMPGVAPRTPGRRSTRQAWQPKPKPPEPYELTAWAHGLAEAAGAANRRLLARADDLARQAWDYLTNERRLTPETIERHGLGINADWLPFHEPMPGQDKPCQLPPGITLPWHAGPHGIAGCNVRKFHKPLGKYQTARGSKRHWLYPHDRQWTDWAGPVLICEGEFDALAAGQELGNLLPVLTLGGSQIRPEDTHEAPWIARASHLLLALDSDAAGKNGCNMWHDFAPRTTHPAELPPGVKDLTEAVQAGHDLAVWLGHVCEGLGIDLRQWPGLVYELPLGTWRGRLWEPPEGFIDPYELAEREAIIWEGCRHE